MGSRDSFYVASLSKMKNIYCTFTSLKAVAGMRRGDSRHTVL
jgi:hypothetical protein